MSKQSSKIAHAAHIKERTKGTSNEVSFSVLHAKANELDGKKDEIEYSRFYKWNPFTLFKGIKRDNLTERSTPVTPSTPVESAKQAANKLKSNQSEVTLPSVSAPKAEPRNKKSSMLASFATVIGGMGQRFVHWKNNRKSLTSSDVSAASAKPKRSYEEEVAVRKALRKKAKITAIATVGALTAGLLAVGVWYGFNQYQTHKGNMAELDQALTLIQEADETVLRVDELVGNPFAVVSISSTGSSDWSCDVVRVSAIGEPVSIFQIGQKELTIDASELFDLRSQIDEVSNTLTEADQKSRSASEGLQNPEDKEAANQVIFCSNARMDMMSAALILTESVQSATECRELANLAWETLLYGDNVARQSAELLGQGSVEEAKASKEKSNEAIAAFQNAYTIFQQAESLYPAVDFSAYYAYLDKKISAMEHAIASDAALIERNKEEAQLQNDAYIAADEEAVAIAKTLPVSPEGLVSAAYETSVEQARIDYEAARLQAGTADAAVRDYLGI